MYKITFPTARRARSWRCRSRCTAPRRKSAAAGEKRRETPIVEAAGEYTFTMQVGGGETPGIDRFGVDGVLWDDGSVEGNPGLKATELELRRTCPATARCAGDTADAAPSNDSTVERRASHRSVR